MVAWANKAWHACNFNPFSEGIEAAGYAAKGFDASELNTLAALIAWRLHANSLPCQEGTEENNWTGFTEHYKLGAAGGGHRDFTTDPTVWTTFVSLVQRAFASPTVTPTSTPAIAISPNPPLGFQPSGTVRDDLTEGSIEWAQAQLNALGYHPVLTVDGIEGPATEHAISNFQGDHNLYQDGILGPSTIQVLKDRGVKND
jgi:hypothetical protein